MTDSGIFIALYLDEDVDVLIASLLRARGFVVTTTRDEGSLGKSDLEQLAYASERGRALVTHNRADFEALVKASYEANKAHHGVIISTRHPAHEVARRLLTILNGVTADEMAGQVRYV